jgi:hemerythrin-like metal-binding protein
MERLNFTDDLKTGIAEIDKQHGELLAKGNAILFPETGKLEEKDILAGLEFLIRYVDEHFSTEERLMKFYGYPKQEGHKKQHQRLRREVEELYRQGKQADSVTILASELHYLLKDWYIYHIKEWDKGYASYLQKQVGLEKVKIPEFGSFEDADIEIIKVGDEF